jgi:general secretion pathway protein K
LKQASRVPAERGVRNASASFACSAREHGIALVIVLWIVTLLTVIASSFVYAMRTDTKVVSNEMARARANAAAEAAVHRAVFELYKPPSLTDRWQPDGVPHEWRYQDATIVVSLTDESAKIDVNSASDQLMRNLFVSQGLNEEEAASLTDAMADWRDADTLRRARGAEEAEYAAAGRTYKPANAPFQTIEELKLVLGMTSDLYQRLEPLITTYSRQPGINSQIASRDVLRAIPGATDALVDAYLVQREQARLARTFVPPFQPALAFQAGGSGFVVGIRATATLDDGTVFVRDAVSLRAANPKRPVVFLRWQEGSPDSPPLTVAGNTAVPAPTASTPVPSLPTTPAPSLPIYRK